MNDVRMQHPPFPSVADLRQLIRSQSGKDPFWMATALVVVTEIGVADDQPFRAFMLALRRYEDDPQHQTQQAMTNRVSLMSAYAALRSSGMANSTPAALELAVADPRTHDLAIAWTTTYRSAMATDALAELMTSTNAQLVHLVTEELARRGSPP